MCCYSNQVPSGVIACISGSSLYKSNIYPIWMENLFLDCNGEERDEGGGREEGGGGGGGGVCVRERERDRQTVRDKVCVVVVVVGGG